MEGKRIERGLELGMWCLMWILISTHVLLFPCLPQVVLEKGIGEPELELEPARSLLQYQGPRAFVSVAWRDG
jgi:hypothetical protein